MVVLRVREFRALWIAELLSVAGDQVARVALAVLVFERTSSAAWTALTYALTFVPALLGGALLSRLADRFPRREVMVATDLCRTVLAALMAWSSLPLPVLCLLVFLLAMCGGPFRAAQLSLLPDVLGDDRYVAGLAVRNISGQIVQMAGFAVGGTLLAIISPYVALGFNAATFLVAALVVRFGVHSRPAPSPVESKPSTASGGGAARLIWRDRRSRGLVGLAWLVGLFVVPEGLAAPYASALAVGPAAVGVLMAADPAGSIIGAWLAVRLFSEETRARLLAPFAVLAGLPLVLCLVGPGLAWSVALWAVSGAFSTAYLMQTQASFVKRIPDHRRGAAVGLASTGIQASQGFAILAGGAVSDLLGPSTAVAAAGALGVALSAVLGLSWLRARHA
ncbi:MFS transporter [Actinosynnema sp. CS-041913]|uniref:MFS transporter n=1 Tax=Actinosynnema sp. CS-041913 TaxID=3239917 RepID=UPI003D916040